MSIEPVKCSACRQGQCGKGYPMMKNEYHIVYYQTFRASILKTIVLILGQKLLKREEKQKQKNKH